MLFTASLLLGVFLISLTLTMLGLGGSPAVRGSAFRDERETPVSGLFLGLPPPYSRGEQGALLPGLSRELLGCRLRRACSGSSSHAADLQHGTARAHDGLRCGVCLSFSSGPAREW